MENWCDGTASQVHSFIQIESRVEAIAAAVLWFICFVIVVSTTIYIYCKRDSCQRPTFVILQMALINLWLIMFAIFYICFDLKTYFKDRKQTLVENIFATLGDLFYLLHLWLFTE